MDEILIPIAAAASALAVVGLATGWLLPWLIHRQLIDAPNARSSHDVPKPRGAGPALMLGLLSAVLMFGARDIPAAILGLGAIGLCALGFMDDQRSLSARARLAVQALIAGFCVVVLPSDLAVAPDLLPFWVERLLIWIGWIWIINLTNFMDGIDGITGVQMGYVGLGACLVFFIMAGPADPHLIWAAALAGTGIGFLLWNWPPSRLFMGDSGSLPLGLISGAVSIDLALHGAPISALLLNGVYWSDATITLIRRALRGQAVWRAHRQHSYQRLAQYMGRDQVSNSAGDHHRTLWVIIVLNAWLLLFAIEALSPDRAWTALAFGSVLLAAYHLIVERLRPLV